MKRVRILRDDYDDRWPVGKVVELPDGAADALCGPAADGRGSYAEPLHPEPEDAPDTEQDAD